jgi:heme exporter protein A
MSAAVLTLHALSCQREGRRLFHELNFTVDAGDYVELTGPNGSGKSTLLRSIAGLFQDYEGAIDCASFLYLGHRAAVSPLLTPLDNCRWFLDLLGMSADPLPALARVGLAGYEDIACQNLSAGQQRRVALARLLLVQRPLWLLDEPLTALDDAGARLVSAMILEQLARDGAVVCATHQSLDLEPARPLMLGDSAAAELDCVDE